MAAPGRKHTDAPRDDSVNLDIRIQFLAGFRSDEIAS